MHSCEGMINMEKEIKVFSCLMKLASSAAIDSKLRSAHHNMFPSKERLAIMYPVINRYKYLYLFLVIIKC